MTDCDAIFKRLSLSTHFLLANFPHCLPQLGLYGSIDQKLVKINGAHTAIPRFCEVTVKPVVLDFQRPTLFRTEIQIEVAPNRGAQI